MSRRSLIYIRMIWKKGLMILPRLFLTLLAAAIAIIGTAFVIYQASGDTNVFPGIDVAIVTDGDSLSVSMGTRMVQEMESVKAVCRFHEVNEEEAVSGLQSGRFQAAAYLPPDIYDDVNNGINTPVKVQVASDSLLSLRIFRDLVDAGVGIIQTGESAVYSVYDTADALGAAGSPSQAAAGISTKFMLLALNRSGTYETSVISPYGEISIPVFYMVTAVLAVMCLFPGLCFSELYRGESRAFRVCLKRAGTGDLTREGAKISIITLVLWGFVTLCSLLLSLLTDFAVFRISGIFILAGLAFSVASYIHMIYSFISGETGSLFYLLISILVFAVGGGLFPSAMLLDMLQNTARFLPVRIWQSCLGGVLMGSSSLSVLRESAISGVIMSAAGITVRKIRSRYI